jgi:hypothetical protein
MIAIKLRNIFLFIMLTLLSGVTLVSCKKIDTFSADGYYSGSFSNQGKSTWTAIVIAGSNYSEVPSGGVYDQKFPCVTKGTYKIKNNIISFSATVLPAVPDCQCGMQTGIKFDCLLCGDYTLVQSGENIVFQRGTGNDLQIYDLTLIKPNPEK